MNGPWIAAVAGMLMVCSSAAVAEDGASGRAKASRCTGCHGSDGISANPLWPNLAGQKMPYLVKQLKAFRDGSRRDALMAPIARPLSDADIADLAAYFSSLE